MHWSDFDFEHRTLTIHRTVTRQRDESGHWADVEDECTKTYFSESIYELNSVACLYFRMKNEECERMSRKTQEYSDCVCVDEFGYRLKLDYVTATFRKMCNKNDIDLSRLHDLRHSCISFLIDSVAKMKETQEYARHANFSTTADIYAHTKKGSKKKSLDIVTDSLGFSDFVASEIHPVTCKPPTPKNKSAENRNVNVKVSWLNGDEYSELIALE